MVSVISTAKLSDLHPHEADITALVKSPQIDYRFFNEILLTTSESYVWVDTEPQLLELANVLSKEKVFAVDTEQHSFRSFLGFTALIQVISHEYCNPMMYFMTVVMPKYFCGYLETIFVLDWEEDYPKCFLNFLNFVLK